MFLAWNRTSTGVNHTAVLSAQNSGSVIWRSGAAISAALLGVCGRDYVERLEVELNNRSLFHNTQYWTDT